VAYRADIEIAVKGAQELKRLGDQISATGKLVDGLNKYLENIGGGGVVRNINNLQDIVGEAAAAFNRAALGTQEATLAAKNYISATADLNTGLREKLSLLKQVNDAERQQRLSAAGIRETTQYGGPIGPGQATPVALSSQLRGRTEQILAERQGARELTEALAQLEERRRLETNALLDEKAAQVQLNLAREEEKRKILAGAAQQYRFPIGPTQRSGRFRFEGDTSVERAEAALQNKEREKQRRLNQQFFAEEKQQLAELDRIRATNAQKQTARLQSLGKTIRGSLSSAAIGGAFPLLFGQSPQAAVGGALGGLLGGAGGGFAGSLLGTALGELEAAKARTKELALELGLSSAQAKALGTAFELAGRNSQQLEAAITNIQGLGLSTNETASAIKIAVELSKDYGGSVEKIAQAFADTLESGKVSISTLNKFTAQGIPIQNELAAKFGVSRTKLLEMAKDGQISVQQVTDTLVAMGREAEKTADKGKTGFDRFTQAVTDVAAAIASAAGALLKTLVPALDTVLTRLASIITRATQAINLLTDATVGEASTALARSGFARGTFTANKGNIDDLTQGLKSLQPRLATTKEQFDLIAATTQRYRAELQQYGGVLGEYAVGTAQVELGRVIADLAAARTKLGAAATPAEITAITAPVNLPPTGAKGPKPPEDRTQQLTEELTAIIAIGQAEDKIRDLMFQGRDLLAAEVELEKQLADITRDRNKALIGANYESERIVINKIAEARTTDAQLKAEDKIREIRQRRFEEELQIKEAVRSSVQVFTDLRTQQELQVQYSKTYYRLLAEGLLPAEAERIANFEKIVAEQLKAVEQQLIITNAAILEAEARGLSTVELQKQLDILLQQQAAITGEAQKGAGVAAIKATPQEKITEKIGKLKEEIAELTNIGNIAITVADGIGTAFSQAFQGLISGSLTAKEALGSFFKSVGDMFVSMAAEIIAKQMTMIILQTILKALGAVGGGGGGGFSGNAAGFGGSFDAGIPSIGNTTSFAGVFGRAGGGPTAAGTSYLVGERGPELFVPGTSGGVMSNSDLRSAMNSQGGGAGGVPVLNMSFESTTIGGVEYVSRDQLEQAMAETRRAASRDGAQRGMTMTLDRIQNSSSTRRRVGI
jgi:tape measure domain-containing protein